MGCGIHAFVEVKKDDKWILMDHPHVPRSYKLFGMMAGVRDTEQTPIKETQGLPDDISEGVKLHAKFWEDDGHSYSWLTGDEAEALSQQMSRELEMIYPCLFGYLFGNGLNAFPKDLNLQDSRLIFWFDN